MSASTSPIKVAAVQLCAELGALQRNLARCESLAKEAFGRGARMVLLPEFFPSAMAFSPKMLSAWQPLEGETLEFMKRLANTHDGVVGGSFIARSGADCFNSYLLVFPDGSYYRHDKDVPTMWENCYYVGGNDDGVFDTPWGPIGAAGCWEFIRSQTPRRLRGKVSIVVGGSCWWDLRLPVAEKYVAQQMALHELLGSAPSKLARMLGVPVVHASHVGSFEGMVPGSEGEVYASRYLGETQIVDESGRVLARMTSEDGDGVICEEITMTTSPVGNLAIPDAYWSGELPPIAQKSWEVVNEFGREYYKQTFRPIVAAAS